MKECRFCQCEIKDAEAFKLTQPDKQEVFFCHDCAQDLINFMLSGESERRKISDSGVFAQHDRKKQMKKSHIS